MATTKRDNRFLIGYVEFNIVNNIGYVIKTEINPERGIGKNDLLNFKNKDQRRLVEGVVLIHAGWLFYRLLRDKDFRTWIGLETTDNGTILLKISCQW